MSKARKRRKAAKKHEWRRVRARLYGDDFPRNRPLLSPVDTLGLWLPDIALNRPLLQGMRFGPEDLVRLGLVERKS